LAFILQYQYHPLSTFFPSTVSVPTCGRRIKKHVICNRILPPPSFGHTNPGCKFTIFHTFVFHDVNLFAPYCSISTFRTMNTDTDVHHLAQTHSSHSHSDDKYRWIIDFEEPSAASVTKCKRASTSLLLHASLLDDGHGCPPPRAELTSSICTIVIAPTTTSAAACRPYH